MTSRDLPSDTYVKVGDREVRIFLSHPHTNNGFFPCSPLNISFILEKLEKDLRKILENPEYAELRHGDAILILQRRHGSTCGQRAAVRFYLSLGLVRMCEIITIHHECPYRIGGSEF